MVNIKPRQGDLILIDSEPHAGHEFGGHDSQKENIRRPMVVLSNTDYNQHTVYVIGMLITHAFKENRTLYYPLVNPNAKIQGSVIMWQTYCYDYNARHGQIIGQVSDKTLTILLDNLRNLFK
ncbi:type II toxin-antitoxin system PemK/MazF family toxin [Lactiplantibacillus nangangensis]|uniref:Type II toxin-antitoxin system PemK/MazF family toxin n=1 Tax=Lactiplantibacillus nangangensis TaxID=2559917 RepID=A0ABW1SL21_9LACO|nr:type II toxin-antitoxin system PemK/MazF family toxin [Lactiplantibacillus nangangensis]